MKKIVWFTLLVASCSQAYSQITFGVSSYTEYHGGTLPIIISVPHGGDLEPLAIPDRTCNNPTLVTDEHTIELAAQIDSCLFVLTGCHAHLIYCNLKRTKVDCNRDLADGACANSSAETAWTEFHDFITSAQTTAQNQNGGKAFYIDLHAHGHAIQQLELGYSLSAASFDESDATLNTNTYVKSSSIKNLVSTNVNSYTHAELLRGNFALGTLLGNAGYPSVPSLQTPSPAGNPYFSGGYNTDNYTSCAVGNTVNGLQIECNSNVRNTYLHRKVFADSLAVVLASYLSIHQNINIKSCNLPSSKQEINEGNLVISPNPAVNFIQLSYPENQHDFEVELSNTFGEIVLRSTNQKKLNISELPKGMYFVRVSFKGHTTTIHKILVD